MSSPASGKDPLIEFLSGHGPDHRGRFLGEIQKWSDDQLEWTHDYIQWMFPLQERSPVNPAAPVLDARSISEIRSRPDIQKNMTASFERMLAFYGLCWMSRNVERGANFPERSRNWLTPGNHNHLRITRILKCLRLNGLEQESGAFFVCLSDIASERRDAISEQTLRYWRAA